MTDEAQLEMFSPVEEEDGIFVENLTLTADKVLMANLGKFHEVLIIGVDEEGASYYSNTNNVPKWLFWLRRCEEFMMRNCT